MSEPKQDQEPSMEEILASIRRIISEDEEPAAESEPAAEVSEPEMMPDEEETALEEDAEESAEILELTDIVDDRKDEDPAPEEEPGEEAIMAVPVEDVSEDDLDAILNEEDSGPEIDFVEEEDEGLAEPEIAAETETQPVSESSKGLLEAGTAMAAGASLSNLVAAVDQAQGRTPLGDGTRTVEDLVKEVMRPMVKEWLDANLPGLVERLVRKEIERLGRSAEGDD